MNIAHRISAKAQIHPDKKAVVFPKKRNQDGSYDYIYHTFKELDELSNQYAHGLYQAGLRKGMKTLLFVTPRLEFSAMVFALFKLGVVPVLIDPGMGRKNLLNAIKQVRPDACIGVPLIHFLRLIFRSSFKGIKHFITTGSFAWGSMKTMNWVLKNGKKDSYMEKMDGPELAAILFTSGGTGIPKGVEYTHTIFNQQTDILRDLFDLNEKQVDVPGFPLFSFFTMAMGMTSCVPDLDPTKPASADPEKLYRNITDHGATFLAGSPAIWKNLATYCHTNNLTLPTVKYLVMFGAPISVQMHEQFKDILTNGTTYTPYGATEGLPVSCISGKEVLEHTAQSSLAGKGTCIGKPVMQVAVKIIERTDSPIKHLSDATELSTGEIGEIIVKGKVITAAYHQMPDKTAGAKIKDDEGFWHRMGDLGYLDEHGRLWFCGRLTHRVELPSKLMCSIPCEAIVNQHPKVAKSALVKVNGSNTIKAGLVIELAEQTDTKKLSDELINTLKQHEHTKDIESIYYYDQLPVDVRHNIKIDRLKLASLVEQGVIR
jgi:acyl-CoA synthetase (AMP-forming)/AMP-acid ligase II